MSDESKSRNSAAWPEWAVRALCALARRILHERNATCGKDWPAGQDWHELGHTSQHAFMRAAREEAGIQQDAYLNAVREICDSQEFDLDMVWQDMDRRSERSGYKPPDAAVSERGASNNDWHEAMAEISNLQRDKESLTTALVDLLGFARRRLATGHIPPQGARAMHLLAVLGVPEYVTLYEQNRIAIDTAAGAEAALPAERSDS